MRHIHTDILFFNCLCFRLRTKNSFYIKKNIKPVVYFNNSLNIFYVYVAKKRMRRLNCCFLNSNYLVNYIHNNSECLLANRTDKHILQGIFFSFRNFDIEKKPQIDNRNNISAKIVNTKDKWQCIRNIGKPSGLCNFLYFHNINCIVFSSE